LTYLGTGTRPLVAWINYDVNSSGNETWTISKAKSNVAYSEDAGNYFFFFQIFFKKLNNNNIRCTSIRTF